jgi:hypothetical protein
MNAEQCSTVNHANMKTLNFHSAQDYAANSTIELVNQVMRFLNMVFFLEYTTASFNMGHLKKGYAVKSGKHSSAINHLDLNTYNVFRLQLQKWLPANKQEYLKVACRFSLWTQSVILGDAYRRPGFSWMPHTFSFTLGDVRYV